MRFRIVVMATLALVPAAAAFPQAFKEDFNDITTLPASGWVQLNHSEPLGTTNWAQGNPAAFPAHAGNPDDYIAANFENGSGLATISNWLLTPPRQLANGSRLIFWTRSINTFFPDRLQVRLSTNGASSDVGTTSTDVGDFTTLLLDINPTYTSDGYPIVWTQFAVTVSGLPATTTGRLAFRYFVEDGGPAGGNSNFIGIDSVDFVTHHRGDFNSNGDTDILWRHDVSGENVAWFMNGATFVGGTFLTPAALPDTRWKMVGTADFDQDADTDILWRHDTSGENVMWFMNGVDLVSGTFTTPPTLTDTNWKMAGTSDFNGDNRPDIVWHHQVSGQVVLWYMNGSVLTSGTFTSPNVGIDPNWKLVGVSDFNADGKPDLLWRHQTSGWNVVWYMNDNTLIGATFTNPPQLADPNWQISGTGRFNQDVHTDIVWRNVSTGENLLWFLNGVTLTSGAVVNPLADTQWKIVGPR